MDGHEVRLVKEMRGHAARNPRYGYRRVHALLRAAGWAVNHKHVHRLWRREGLWVPVIKHKRRRLGCSENGILRRRSERMNHVWTYDFIMDRTADGRRLKFLTVVDEYTRESLAIEVARGIDARGVIAVLERLAAQRGMPGFIRSDNGPEFIAVAVREWLNQRGGGTLFIAPGSPWENAYIESFNGKLRDEFLECELFSTLAEARWLTERWRKEYNEYRPHSSLEYRTPAAFASECRKKKEAEPRDCVERGDAAPLPSQTHPSTPPRDGAAAAPEYAADRIGTMVTLS